MVPSPRGYSISNSLEEDLEEIERDYIRACRDDVVHMERIRENLRSRENQGPRQRDVPAVKTPILIQANSYSSNERPAEI